MKTFWAAFGGQLAASLVPFTLIAVAGYVVWRKFFGGQTPSALVSNVTDAAASIPSGLYSLTLSKLRGESEGGYISQTEAKELAALELARRQGRL